MPTLKKFEELDVWKDAKDIYKEIYLLTQKNMFNDDLHIVEQLMQIAIRIPNQIAQGVELDHTDQFVNYLEGAKMGCTELLSSFSIVTEIKSIDSSEKIKFEGLINSLSIKITSLVNYLQPKDK